ncbi:MAG: putative glycosyltransferase family 1 [Oscillospiraceae bacterium]|nr:putative glycosyltransferase family 1 [Oscillospiraceae bacterium]
MKQIMCFSNLPWSSTPTRTQHLVARFKEAEILFFDPPAPRGQPVKTAPRRVRPNITVYSLPHMMSSEGKNRFLYHRNQRKLFSHIESILIRHNFREPLLWVTSPENVHLLDLLTFRGMIYDCDRYWDDLPEEWERDLTATADVIFAASPGLVKRLSAYNNHVTLIPNGVNYPMFRAKSLDIPSELEQIRYPLLGWVGTIHPDLDLTPVTAAAKTRTDWTFALVGQAGENSELAELSQLPNVKLLGPREAMSIPDYLGRFDACLDLSRAQDEDNDVIPCRIYEYLSTGKPIVSLTRACRESGFSDVIYHAEDASQFLSACKKAISGDALWLPLRRQELGSAAAWPIRTAEMLRTIRTAGLYPQDKTATRF